MAPLAPRDPQPFDVLGRVLVTYSGSALTANLRWEHGAQQDQIWLMTPTGQTLAYQTNGQGVEQIMLVNLETGVHRVLVDGGAMIAPISVTAAMALRWPR